MFYRLTMQKVRVRCDRFDGMPNYDWNDIWLVEHKVDNDRVVWWALPMVFIGLDLGNWTKKVLNLEGTFDIVIFVTLRGTL